MIARLAIELYTRLMARRDKIHEAVKKALINDGWTITDDPYWIKYKTLQLPADLGAERPIAAERGTEKIVVEIKSFLSTSLIPELQAALAACRRTRQSHGGLTKNQQVTSGHRYTTPCFSG